MWDYLVVAFVVAVLILLRIYLTGVAYTKKKACYSRPLELYKEAYGKL